MSDLAAKKKAARAAGFAAREAAHRAGAGAERLAAAHALEAIAALHHVRTVSAYLPIRSEIDPRPAMLALHGRHYRLCVPVIDGKGLPLRFRAWTPGARVVHGNFGVEVPVEGDWLEPEVLLVPLVAFDDQGHRLGYGGGFYDRTLIALRAHRPVHAYGFAYEGQRVPELPLGGNDARLDAVITEKGIHRPA